MTFDGAVESWFLDAAAHELAESGVAQIDIDNLIEPPPAKAARATISCMKSALDLASRSVPTKTISGLVVIPLPFVDDQDVPPTTHPPLASVLDADWVYGPGREVPGLYLLRAPLPGLEVGVEEYRLGLAEANTLLPGFGAYYRAWRTLGERDRVPLEWSRAIYIVTD